MLIYVIVSFLFINHYCYSIIFIIIIIVTVILFIIVCLPLLFVLLSLLLLFCCIFNMAFCTWFPYTWLSCPVSGPHCKNRHVRRVFCLNYLAGFCPKGPNCKNSQYVSLYFANYILQTINSCLSVHWGLPCNISMLDICYSQRNPILMSQYRLQASFLLHNTRVADYTTSACHIIV